MLLVKPNATQSRAAAVALVIIAALTAALVAVEWVEALDGPLLLPLTVAYFVFNFGYVFAVVMGRLQTKGARIGLGAVLLNVLAMFLSSFAAAWTVMSMCAVVAALVGSFLPFRDTSRAAAKCPLFTQGGH